MTSRACTRRSLIASVAAVAFAGLAWVPLARAETVLAVAGPMTGGEASFGDQFRQGAQMAVSDLNARGGLLGQKIRLETADDVCDPKQAVAVANQLAGKRAVFVAGHYCSGSSIPASDVYAEEGVLQITPGSTNPQLTERKLQTVFRVCGRDDQQGQIAAKFLLESYRTKRIAIVHDKSAYGKGVADETKKSLNAGGVQEALYEAITKGERDFSALVSRLKAERIDVVYFGGYHSEAGLIVRQMRQSGLEALLMGADSLFTSELWSIAGPSGNGLIMTFPPDPRERPEVKDLVERFRKGGYEPEGYTLYTYAAFEIYAQAAAKAKSTKAVDVAAALRQGEFETVIGRVRFDAKGDVVGNTYTFYELRDGQYRPLRASR